MRPLCQCGARIVVRRSKGRHGVKRPGMDHDLCMRCHKAEQDRARLMPEQREEAVFVSLLKKRAGYKPAVLDVPAVFSRAVAEHVRAGDSRLSVDFWQFQLERGHVSFCDVPLRVTTHV